MPHATVALDAAARPLVVGRHGDAVGWRRPPSPDLGPFGPHLGWVGPVARRSTASLPGGSGEAATSTSLVGVLQRGDRDCPGPRGPDQAVGPSKSSSPRPVGYAAAMEAVPSHRSSSARPRGRCLLSLSRPRVGSSREMARVVR